MTEPAGSSTLAPVRPAKTHDYRREALGLGREIRRFEALGGGRYVVEGIGPDVLSKDRIRFTLKGSKSLELVLEVHEIKHKLVPTHGWSAVLAGEDFDSFDIHRWTIRCDGCGLEEPFEFTAPVDASQPQLQDAAGARIGHLGWYDQDGHLCPSCGENER